MDDDCDEYGGRSISEEDNHLCSFMQKLNDYKNHKEIYSLYSDRESPNKNIQNLKNNNSDFM